MASPSNLLDLHEHPNKAYSPDTHNVPSIVPVKSLPGNQTLKNYLTHSLQLILIYMNCLTQNQFITKEPTTLFFHQPNQVHRNHHNQKLLPGSQYLMFKWQSLRRCLHKFRQPPPILHDIPYSLWHTSSYHWQNKNFKTLLSKHATWLQTLWWWYRDVFNNPEFKKTWHLDVLPHKPKCKLA